jgi:virginiamycin B lyase
MTPAHSAAKLRPLSPPTRRADLLAPGPGAPPHAVIVAEHVAVWVSDCGKTAIPRVNPATHHLHPFPLPDRYANVRQLAGRKGEVWGAESGADKLFVIKTE